MTFFNLSLQKHDATMTTLEDGIWDELNLYSLAMVSHAWLQSKLSFVPFDLMTVFLH